MKLNLLHKEVFLKVILCLVLFQACTYNHVPESNKTLILNWYPAPANQTKEEFTKGMIWLFSYLGAKLPAEKFDKGVHFISGNKIEINIEELGFADFAIIHLQSLLLLIKETEEYRVTGGIDAGRFFALCFNSSYQYYKITGTPDTYKKFGDSYANFAFKTFVCDTSSISPASRIINYSIDELNIQRNFFICEEGDGFYGAGTFVKNGIIEAFDYMENGQPRFVIYNQDGNLFVPSNSSAHVAGKPAKCMWCHESGMQPLFNSTADIPGFVSTSDFLIDQEKFTLQLNNFHKQTGSVLDFADKSAHTQGEFIYLCFNEPDAKRLSEEWNISPGAVEEILSGIPTHTNIEFPFMKKVYYRKQIKLFAPFSSIEVSDEMREATPNEPNYFQ